MKSRGDGEYGDHCPLPRLRAVLRHPGSRWNGLCCAIPCLLRGISRWRLMIDELTFWGDFAMSQRHIFGQRHL